MLGVRRVNEIEPVRLRARPRVLALEPLIERPDELRVGGSVGREPRDLAGVLVGMKAEHRSDDLVCLSADLLALEVALRDAQVGALTLPDNR